MNEKICGLVLSVYRDRTFFKYLPKINPKPDIFIIRNTKPLLAVKDQLQSIADGYNKCRLFAPDDTTHYWIVEDDCILPTDVLQTLKNDMIKANCDVVTVPVYNRFAKHLMVWNLQKTIHGELYKKDIIDKTGLKQVDVSSLNCFLIKKDVFLSEYFSISNHNKELYVDTLFFARLRKKGFTVYCNFNVRTEHGGLVWFGHENEKNSSIGM